MPSLNFQSRFAEDVEAGIKRQTIRAYRKAPIYPGDKLFLYSGMRTPSCRKLGVGLCLAVQGISIGSDAVYLAGVDVSDLQGLAIADGFLSWEEMRDWFKATHGLTFEGHLIKWELNGGGQVCREENRG